MKDKTRKDIIIIISYIALVIFALVNFSKILAFLGKVISIFSPFLLGIILAFVLNVLNNLKRRFLVRLNLVRFGIRLKDRYVLHLV